MRSRKVFFFRLATATLRIEEILMLNRTKTLVLLATLTALFLFVGQAMGGGGGLLFAGIFAAAMNLGAYWFSDKIVLRMYNAQEVGPTEAPELFGMVQSLATRAGLPMPRVYVIPEDAPNAFATGRNPKHAAVAVTDGILRMLSRDELEGVIAHELGHVKNRDTLIMAVAATIAGALGHLANMAMWGMMFGGMGRRDDEEDSGIGALGGLLGMIIAPLAATLIQMAISRTREFGADEAAARMTMQPMALAGALRKIEGWSHRVPMGAATPATAHLFIINPLHGGGLVKLFSTHPPTEERIARLEALTLHSARLVA
jgi:heat shock protein HtpX